MGIGETKNDLLGIDVGSSLGKASLLDAATGCCAGGAFYPKTEQTILLPQPGFAEQNPQDWYDCSKDAVRLSMRDAGANLEEVKAIGRALIDKLGRKLLRIIGSLGMVVLIAFAGLKVLGMTEGEQAPNSIMWLFIGYLLLFGSSTGAVIWVTSPRSSLSLPSSRRSVLETAFPFSRFAWLRRPSLFGTCYPKPKGYPSNRFRKINLIRDLMIKILKEPFVQLLSVGAAVFVASFFSPNSSDEGRQCRY